MKVSAVIAKALGEEIKAVWPDLGTASILREHLADLGYSVSYSTTLLVVKELGLPLHRGARTLTAPNARALTIIERREAGAKYQTIGDEFGISRERVRQILARWRPDLTGYEDISVLVQCPHCGTKHTRLPSSPKKFCDRTCWAEYHATRPTDIEQQAMDTALRMRPNGATWREVADALGMNTCFGLPTKIRRAAKKTGQDVSACFGLWNGHTP